MSWKLRVLVPALLLAPQAVLALGLGEIRLGSALNEPLSAEIDLVAATSEELTTLSAQLASRDLFQRYGLDRPGFLDSLEFRVGRGQDGRNVLLVRSRQPIAEPFVTFLVEVNWPRGRLLREYTVLLDPPVFAPPARPAAPVAAPRVEAPPVARPAPAPVPAPRPAPAAQPAPPPVTAAAPSTYRVRSGDTLFQVAGELSGGGRTATHQMMIALFRANPEAFGGNINLMRAGAILRVPSAGEVSQISPGEASTEVQRQISAWRSDSQPADTGRLRLVTPAEPAAEQAPTAPPPTATAPADVRSQISSLQQEIDQQRRLLELRNQELAELQAQLARTQAAERAAAEAAAPGEGEAEVAPADDPGAVAATPEAPAAEAPAPAEQVAPTEEPGFLDSLSGNWAYILGAAGLLLGGLLGYGYVRRRREEDLDEALRGFELPATAPVPSETARLRTLAASRPEPVVAAEPEERDFGAEEPAAARPEPAAKPRREHAADETISAEAALDLDQADPLAEADFHMAYGLYDQAADIVRRALQQEPDRSEFKMKLAEIHFVAGDSKAFLDVAHELKPALGEGGDWDRIVIMGRQIAPNDMLFSEGGTASMRIDLSLEGGDSQVDVDLLGPPSGEGGLDMDIGEAFGGGGGESDSQTGETTGLEWDVGEAPAAKGARKQGTGTVEMPTIEMPAAEAPTVESPALRGRRSDTMRQRIEGRGFDEPGSADPTAEVSVDELGLDVGDLDRMSGQDEATQPGSDDSTRLMPRKRADQDEEGTAVLPELDSEGTAVLPELGDMDEAGKQEDRSGQTTRTEMMSPDELPGLSDLEPVTMSEVGTKLDLARAYMDMGDPDGARNILEEVLAEGSASQKKEARRLIDSLPGA